MPHELEIAVNLGAAWLAGTVIGLERSFNGRAAGFRTHALVALAAAATAVVSLEPMLFPGMAGVERLDASRLSQGVMTGIGFLGAGVIFKEGLTVQGLTTAASVWACAAAGFLFGLGMHAPAVMVVVAIMVTLILFRLLEDRIPWRVFSFAVFRFPAEAAPSEAELAAFIRDSRVSLRDVSYRLIDGGKLFEYSANLEAAHGAALYGLAGRLRKLPGLVEFELERVGR
jgi:putative Mg2+ transporter-C (MgtC) family protein